jgi:hypothetical protein
MKLVSILDLLITVRLNFKLSFRKEDLPEVIFSVVWTLEYQIPIALTVNLQIMFPDSIDECSRNHKDMKRKER